MRSEEVDHAQNPDWSKEGIGSKLLNGTICPKPSSVSGPLMLVKRLCLIQESRINHSWKREEEISFPSISFFFFFLFFKVGYSPSSLIYEGRGRDCWCLSLITGCGSHHHIMAGASLVCPKLCFEENLFSVASPFALTSSVCSLLQSSLKGLSSFFKQAAA